MTRLHRRRTELARRRTRALLLVGLLGFTAAAVAFFAAGLVLPGLLATISGLARTRPPPMKREGTIP